MTAKKAGALADAIRKQALGYPETTEDHPWGESAFKVKGKTFVFMRAEGDALSFSLKLPDSREFALEFSGSIPTPYGLGPKGWVTMRPLDGKVPLGVIRGLIDESFRAVAPKGVLKKLDAR